MGFKSQLTSKKRSKSDVAYYPSLGKIPIGSNTGLINGDGNKTSTTTTTATATTSTRARTKTVTSTRTRADLESLWMEGFLHHEEVKKGAGTPPSSSNTSNDQRTNNKANRKQIESYSFSAEDQRRLLEAQNRLFPKKKVMRVGNGDGNGMHHHASAKNLNSPYASSKQQRSSRHVCKGKRQIRSKLIESYFQTNRKEMEASIVIQLLWRSIVAKRRLHNLAMRRLAATTIQAAIRASNARAWVKVWKVKREFYVIRCQTLIRQQLAARMWKIKLGNMHAGTIHIQRVIRGFLARRFSQSRKNDRAATQIQFYYKGIKMRRRYTLLKKRYSATQIQKEARRSLAKSYVRKFSIVMATNVIIIQSCWRGHCARARRSKILVERHYTQLHHRILMLDAEIIDYEDKLEKLLAKTRYVELSQEINNIKNEVLETRSNLLRSERNISDLIRQKAGMTPAFVEEGWEEQIDSSLQYERNVKTKLEINIVLKMGKHLKKAERGQRETIRLQKELENKISERQNSKAHLVERMRKGSKKEGCLEKAIADEKRRWKVHHKTKSGKPMKVLQQKNIVSTQFCSGAIDMFTNEDTKDPKTKLMNMIALKSYMTQINYFEGMLKPINSFRK